MLVGNCTLAANLDSARMPTATQYALSSMTASRKLLKKVSGHLVHYSDEDTDAEISICYAIVLQRNVSIAIQIECTYYYKCHFRQ